MSCKEVDDHIFAKAIANASLIRLPILIHVSGIAPEKIIEESIIWDVRGSCNLSDVIHVLQTRRQTAMHTEDLACHDGSYGQAIEGVNKRLPDFDIASPFAFIVESINPCNIGTLMIAAEDEKVFRELELIAEQKEDGLKALFSTVYIVPKEQIIGFWRKATHLKEPDEIIVLPMDVAHNFHRRRQFD